MPTRARQEEGAAGRVRSPTNVPHVEVKARDRGPHTRAPPPPPRLHFRLGENAAQMTKERRARPEEGGPREKVAPRTRPSSRDELKRPQVGTAAAKPPLLLPAEAGAGVSARSRSRASAIVPQQRERRPRGTHQAARAVIRSTGQLVTVNVATEHSSRSSAYQQATDAASQGLRRTCAHLYWRNFTGMSSGSIGVPGSRLVFELCSTTPTGGTFAVKYYAGEIMLKAQR